MATAAKNVCEDVSVVRRLPTLGSALVLNRLRRRLWSTHRAIAVVRQLEPHAVEAGGGMQVDFVDPEAFDALPRLAETAVGSEYLYVRPLERARRARAGKLAVATDREGNLMAFHFVHAREDADALDRVAPDMYPQMADDEVLTEAVYCLPAYRGRDVTANLLKTTGALLAKQGTRRAWAYLDTTNVASLRTFKRAGYDPSGTERVDRFRFFRFSTAFRELTPATLDEWKTTTANARPTHSD